MRSTSLSCVLLSATVLLSGCGLYEMPDKPSWPDAPIINVDKPTAADVFNQLSKLVDNGTVKRLNDLAQFVVILCENGDLSQADAAKFDRAFPGAPQSANDRDLTKDDSSKLRGIQ